MDDLITQITDEHLLKYLAHCMKDDNSNLFNKLVEQNEKFESKDIFLKELIELNKEYALEKYLELAQKAKTIPDIHKDDSLIGEITLTRKVLG